MAAGQFQSGGEEDREAQARLPAAPAGHPPLDTPFTFSRTSDLSDAAIELALDILVGQSETPGAKNTVPIADCFTTQIQADLQSFIIEVSDLGATYGREAVRTLYSILHLIADAATVPHVTHLPDIVRSIYDRFGDGDRLTSVMPACQAAHQQLSKPNFARFVSDVTVLAHRLPPSHFEAVQRLFFSETRIGDCNENSKTIAILSRLEQESVSRTVRDATYHLLHVACFKGWSPAAALEFAMPESERDATHIRSVAERLRKTAPLFKDESLPLDMEFASSSGGILSEGLLGQLRQNAADTGCKLFNVKSALGQLQSLAQRNLLPESESAQRTLVQRISFYIARNEPAYQAIRVFCAEIELAEKTRASDTAVETLLYRKPGQAENEVKSAGLLLKNEYGADQHPAASNDLGKINHLFGQTAQIFRGLLDSYYGFASLQFAARRFAGEVHSPLGQLAIDLADSAGYVYNSDPLSYPGYGLLIDGLNPERFLSTRPDREDPFAEHKAANPWLAAAIDAIRDCQIVLLRGAIAIIPTAETSGPSFSLELENGRRESYGYVVFNDHFANVGRHKAFLVPSLILQGKLHQTVIPMNAWNAGVRAAPNDIGSADFSAAGFIAAGKKYGSPVLDLGTPSVYSGGLCNAFPVKSAPYWSWERNRDFASSPFKDLHGHQHKTFATGRWRQEMTPELQRCFEKFERGHQDVFQTAQLYQAIHNLFRLAHSLWNKGFTATADAPDWDSPDWQSPAGTSAIRSEQFLADLGDEAAELSKMREPRVYRHSFRMLHQANLIHESLHDSGVRNPKAYPVLVSAPTFRYAASATADVSLDTYNMVLRVDGLEPISLLYRHREEQEAIWQRHVLPLYADMTMDLRFYDKE